MDQQTFDNGVDKIMAEKFITAMDELTEQHISAMPSGEFLTQLQTNDGNNALMQVMLSRLSAKINEAKRQHFSKPVVTMMMGASGSDSVEIVKRYPEIREFIFERNEAVADAVFQACRHMSIRKCLLQLLRPDSDAVTDPYTHQILLDGVYPHEHEFVFKTGIPMVDIAAEKCDVGSRHFMVVDLCRSKNDIDEILSYSRTADASETLVVAPYDQRMWTYFGGNQHDARYVFEWAPTTHRPEAILTKPAKLPSHFFTNALYRTWHLYVQPFGSDKSIRYSRDQFMKLFRGTGAHDRFVETRAIRNGFAEVSFIGYETTEISMPIEKLQEQEMQRAIPVGMVEVRPVIGNIAKESFMVGRQFDLARASPTYVRKSYYDKAIQQLFRLRFSRQVIPAMMRTLHANSARLVYNGAIVVAETMVDVETMCMVAEDVILSNTSSKQLLVAQAAKAQIPMQQRPLDYFSHVVQWAAIRSMKSVDLVQGAKEVSTYLNSIVSGKPQDGGSGEVLEVLPPLRYGDPQSFVASEKDEFVQAIIDVAEDTFTSIPTPYVIEREGIEVDRADAFALRMKLRQYALMSVAIEDVQAIYDSVLPGNSLIDPTVAQMQAEAGDAKFILDVQYFRVAIPSMFSPLDGYQVIPSRLRTSVGADLMGSFRSLMRSLMKRNFNRPRPEAPGDRVKFVQQAFEMVVKNHGLKHSGMLLALYHQHPISMSDDVVKLWADKHPVSDVVAAATLLETKEMDPSVYRLMPKDIPKPAMSLSAQGAVYAGQTVVFHSKDMIAITVGVFTVLVSRLLALFGNNIRFAYGADEHTSGQWADTYLDIPGTYVEEIDIPKFDKSQDWVCFELVLYVMELMGVAPDVLEFWRRAADQATVFSSTLHLVFETMFGNRSGSGGTLAVNCIVLLFAFLHSFDDAGIIAIIIKGDDSVLVTKRPLEARHEAYLYERWGFSMKRVGRKECVQFCSSVFVKDSTGHYRLVRNLLRLVEKAGRALPVNKPAHYFLDYYTSFVDAALAYDDPVLVENLQIAESRIVGKEFDIRTLVKFVQYIASSSKTFLQVLYGLTDAQLKDIRDIDDAVEIIQRVRSVRFTKGKDLVTADRGLRLNLVDKMKISADWIYEACE